MIKRLGLTWKTCGQEPDQKEDKDEHGRLIDKRPTNKKEGINMGDLWTLVRPIRR